MQTVHITGRVRRKKHVNNDKYQACYLTLVTGRYNGKDREQTGDFHDAVIYGEHSKSIFDNLDENDKFEIVGTLKYTLKEHAKKKFKEAIIIVDNFEYHTSKKIKELIKNSCN